MIINIVFWINILKFAMITTDSGAYLTFHDTKCSSIKPPLYLFWSFPKRREADVYHISNRCQGIYNKINMDVFSYELGS